MSVNQHGAAHRKKWRQLLQSLVKRKQGRVFGSRTGSRVVRQARKIACGTAGDESSG